MVEGMNASNARPTDLSETPVILYYSMDQRECERLDHLRRSAVPARPPEDPILYLALTEQHAAEVAAKWDAARNGSTVGYVGRLKVAKSFLDRYEVHSVGGSRYREYWIPAEDIDELNRGLLGPIEVIGEYRAAVA
jgi:hypothetical protein